MSVKGANGGFCIIRYPSENNHQLKYCEILFVRNLFLSCLFILKFFLEHDSDTAKLAGKFQNVSSNP